MNILKKTLLFCVLNILLIACGQNKNEKAIDIVHQTFKSMGGVENYNRICCIKWEFANRTLYWNKWTGDVRIEAPEDNLTLIVNINTLKGKAYENNKLVTDEEHSKELLIKAKKWWINDSYWLVMPWKLLDPGVTLTYLREDLLPNGNKSDVIELTFQDVGVTPNNKYEIYVDRTDSLIKQWAYFKNYTDTKPTFIKIWDNYQKLENVLFSFNRSDFGPKNVEVNKSFNTSLFTGL